jgi:L-2-hydroxyglutarate oxidase LhgO
VRARRKLNGAKFVTDAWVEDIELSPEGTHVKAVKTNRGTIKCDTVINAAGAHAYHIAKVGMLSLSLSRQNSVNTLVVDSLWGWSCRSCR